MTPEEQAQADADAAKAKADADAAKAKADADAAKAKGDEGKGKYDEDYVSKLRKEAADNRAEAKKHKEALDKIEADKLAEQGEYKKIADKALAEKKATEDRLNSELSKRDQRYMQSELKAAAAEAGIIDADLVRLVDMDIVKMNDDGTVEGVKTAIEALKTAKPHLFKAPTENKDDKNNKRNNGDPPPRQQNQRDDQVPDARKLSDEDFDKLWNAKAGRRA